MAPLFELIVQDGEFRNLCIRANRGLALMPVGGWLISPGQGENFSSAKRGPAIIRPLGSPSAVKPHGYGDGG
ncbi:MAG TPA: hypothetical protein VK604_12620, partial [Bryobacteraceae bacterium]|nr:hypothetical protein [Bryobacteraceae bacterium]